MEMDCGEGFSGTIDKQTDTFPISSRTCLKESREKPVLAVNIGTCPLPAWVIRNQDADFLICSAFWITMKGRGGEGWEGKSQRLMEFDTCLGWLCHSFPSLWPRTWPRGLS